MKGMHLRDSELDLVHDALTEAADENDYKLTLPDSDYDAESKAGIAAARDRYLELAAQLRGEPGARLKHDDDYGRKALRRRARIGRSALALVDDNDDETNASDLISDVLTALFGPPVGAAGEAAALLDRAFRSYLGDSEDYELEVTAEARDAGDGE